ncbi:FkbM family methyltransferase [Sphingomonas crusticola]|uniref:FkbM family methyltransferase n=1 Tax=Sphingomonas crusticola TaxID=1697973 RepID=UPI000E280A36|nr:FkbM family methyltransferase [Sphingomonas crusticola]
MLEKFVHRLARRLGVNLSRYTVVSDQYELLTYWGQQCQVDTLVDVGANVGQFSLRMIDAGWTGSILSVEPLSSAHAKLVEMAALTSRWKVAAPAALGATEGIATINVAGNSQSSSLLPMLRRHEQAAPDSSYVRTETVAVKTLPQVLTEAGLSGRFILKLDVQGFEGEVLKGAAPVLDRCPIVFTEMSLQPLYAGEPLFYELSATLIGMGYRCVNIKPGYFDQNKREVVQVDGTFVRD